jgi:hypothetical protein
MPYDACPRCVTTRSGRCYRCDSSHVASDRCVICNGHDTFRVLSNRHLPYREKAPIEVVHAALSAPRLLPVTRKQPMGDRRPYSGVILKGFRAA